MISAVCGLMATLPALADSPQGVPSDGALKPHLVCNVRLLRGNPRGSIEAGTVKVVRAKRVRVDQRDVMFLTKDETPFGIKLDSDVILRPVGRVRLRPGEVYLAMYAQEVIVDPEGQVHRQLFCGGTATIGRPFTRVLRNKATGDGRFVPGRAREEPSDDALWVEVIVERTEVPSPY
jgi:hypothetical protein